MMDVLMLVLIFIFFGLSFQLIQFFNVLAHKE